MPEPLTRCGDHRRGILGQTRCWHYERNAMGSETVRSPESSGRDGGVRHCRHCSEKIVRRPPHSVWQLAWLDVGESDVIDGLACEHSPIDLHDPTESCDDH